MKNLKSLFRVTAIAFMLCFIFSANAQVQYEITNSAQIADNDTNYAIDELELDDVKANNLKSINQAYTERMRQLMRKGSGASEDEIEALKRSHNNKIKSILDVKEYEKFLLLKAKLRKEREAEEKKMKSKQ